MRCIVTGGAGFIGSHLVDALIRSGHRVTVIDNFSTGKRENINPHASFYELQIEDSEVEEAFKKESPDYVFHLAAQTDVRRSSYNPIIDAETGIIGTLNLLRLSSKYKTKKIVFASSGGGIYGDRDKAVDERTLPNPSIPYGISKLAAERYIEFYWKERRLSFTILRYANVYGPRQDSTRESGVVAIFTRQMLSKKPCVLYGFGKMIRDYIYVEDAISATMKALEKGANEIINIGTGVSTSVNELFSIMKRLIAYPLDPIYKPKRRSEVLKNTLLCEKAKRILEWTPKTSLESGINKTILWFKNQKSS